VEPTLIVPLIGSVESVRTLRSAGALARTFDGRLVLLRAVPHRRPHARRADEEHVRRELESLAHGLRKEGIAAEAQVRRAEPGAAIIDAVREFDATAVVRSSDDGKELAGWLRRMIVDEVMHQIQIPVLIIPAGEVPAPVPGSRLRVLVPLDGSSLAESALVHILGIARPRPLEIRLVDVVHLRFGPLGALLPSVPDSKTERRATTRYLHDVAATLRTEGMVTHTDVIESQDSVGRALLDLVRRSVVDVVVMATHGLNTPGHLPQGRVTTEVLEHCPVPVLLVPGPSGMASTSHASQRGRPDVVEMVQH
jgi:nucleotide-binding universal stress UspA family protein